VGVALELELLSQAAIAATSNGSSNIPAIFTRRFVPALDFTLSIEETLFN
jgi:hypothetical protein